jgi:CDP-glucose 4,6-dehydratase
MESLGLNPSFWRGRRVLLTGQTGFKGAWLALWLERLGAEVHSFALAAEADALWPRLAPAPGKRNALTDLRDADDVAAQVRDAAPDIVLHLAAQAIVRRGYGDPAGTFATNVQGTINLIEALRSVASLRALLVITSDKVYRDPPAEDGFLEGDALGGADPYSASKAACEIVVAAYGQSILRPEGIAVATARAGNIVGGGDMGQDRLVPDIVRAVADNETLRLRAPEALRPWLHALDALSGYLAFAEQLVTRPAAAAPALNFGPDAGSRRTVHELVEVAFAAWGVQPHIEAGKTLPVEPKPLWLDSTLARRSLGWRPRLTFEQTIGWTADWWQRLAKGERARDICARQIEAYTDLER